MSNCMRDENVFISDCCNKVFLKVIYENAVRHCLKKAYDLR